MIEAIIGLGSNKGNRQEFIRRALSLINATRGLVLKDVSSVYESPAQIMPGARAQVDFLNAVCAVDTQLSPEELLTACLAIETKCGRTRTTDSRWESRTLDLDILLYGKISLRSENLTIPHGRIAARNFVLVPLEEIRPDLHIPAPIDTSVQYLLNHCPDADALHLVSSRGSLLGDEKI